MSSPLRLTPATPPEAHSSHDPVEAWLRLLTGMMRGPQAELHAVRDELESHLRDRVQDLMITGLSESHAVVQAISELGDAALLARRYQEAIAPSKWRHLMQIAALSIAAAAVALSGTALFRASTGAPQTKAEAPALARQSPAILECPPEQTVEALAGAGDDLTARYVSLIPMVTPAVVPPTIRTSEFTPVLGAGEEAAEAIQCTVDGTISLGRLVELLETGPHPVAVRWESLETSGVSRDTSFPVPASRCTALALLNSLNNSLTGAQASLGIRLNDGTLVLATNQQLDRLEQSLVTYDLGPLVERRQARSGAPVETSAVVSEAMQVIQQLVYPDDWQSNGGDLARSMLFDSKVFIEAPARFHPKIRWVLEELLSEAPIATAAPTMRTVNGVPMLSSLPILRESFRTGVTQQLPARSVIRATDGGQVEVRSGDTTTTAQEVTIENPAPRKP